MRTVTRCMECEAIWGRDGLYFGDNELHQENCMANKTGTRITWKEVTVATVWVWK